MIKYIKSWFSIETEFTKKWIARFTILVSVVVLFYVVLSQELLFLHLTRGLSKSICKIFFDAYSSVVKVCITGYSVTFIGSMVKAFMAKQQEEANKTKLILQNRKKEEEEEEDEEEDEDEECIDEDEE